MFIRTIYLLRLLLLHSLLISALASGAEPSQAASKLPPQYWGHFSWVGQQQPDHGLSFDLMQELTTRLPEYQHRYQVMSLSRGFIDIQQRDDLCMVAVIQSAERDQVGYFVGLWPILPPHVVIRSADRHTIAGDSNRLSLAELLQRPDLRGALIRERSYGPELAPLLSAGLASGQLKSLQTSNHNNLLNMLNMGRIDFTLDYLESFLGSTEAQPELKSKLLLLPLQEAQTPRIAGIYCPRTPHGKQLIERIDQLARDSEVNSNFQSIVNRYIPSEVQQPYADWLNEFYSQRPQRSLTNLPD